MSVAALNNEATIVGAEIAGGHDGTAEMVVSIRYENGVTGSVTGLFYGDASQLVAQIIGIATLVGFVFTFSFVLNWILDILMGQRVSAATEIAGLDIPEMGQLGYPEFVFKPEPEFMLAAERAFAV